MAISEALFSVLVCAAGINDDFGQYAKYLSQAFPSDVVVEAETFRAPVFGVDANGNPKIVVGKDFNPEYRLSMAELTHEGVHLLQAMKDLDRAKAAIVAQSRSSMVVPYPVLDRPEIVRVLKLDNPRKEKEARALERDYKSGRLASCKYSAPELTGKEPGA